MFKPNVQTPNGKDAYLYIPANAGMDTLMARLQPFLKDESTFKWVADQRDFTKVRPGRFRLTNGMNNKTLVALLQSGKQTPVKVTFNNVHFRQDLAAKLDRFLEADSASIIKVLNDDALAQKLGMTHETFMCIFMPNTYELYWNITPEQFVERMKKEYDRFWTDKRKQQASAVGLNPEKAIIVASIVQEETPKRDEYRRIAGVYMNRVNKGWRLDADPTLKFAAGDFTLRRVLNKHRENVHPYNTYLNPGLPPGPVCLAEPEAIEAVLDYEKHDYMFFCAKPDLSGYSNFAVSLSDHNRNAAIYQNWLNTRNIR